MTNKIKAIVFLLFTFLVIGSFHISSHLSSMEDLWRSSMEDFSQKFQRSTIKHGDDFTDLQSRFPNIPVFGWLSMKNMSNDGEEGCSKYPRLTDLNYNNKYWQIFKFSDNNPELHVTFYLYGAYFDNRTLLPNGPMIRVTSMVNSRGRPTSLPFCHTWYNDSKSPAVTQVEYFEQVGVPDGDWAREERDDLLQPYLLSCPILKGKEDRIPVSVSLVQSECQKDKKPSNNLRIFNNHREDGVKKGIAVCSKALSILEDNSLRLIEWIELLRALGAEKVIIGVLSVHPNLMKVFDYYESLGVLEVIQTTLPATQPNDPVLTNIFMKEHSGGENDPFVQQWRTEQIPVNDCYLKNMNMYKYIVNIDIDEVIVPTNKTGPTWVEMMQVLENVTENESIGTWEFLMSWFLDDLLTEPFRNIPGHLHIMQHIFRTEQYNPTQKSFFNTETVYNLNQHMSWSCIAEGLCGRHSVDTGIGQNQHYRRACYDNQCPQAENVVRDDQVWTHLDTVIKNSNRAIKAIEFDFDESLLSNRK